MATFVAMRAGCRLYTHHAAAAFGSHNPRWALPNVADGHLWPVLLGLVAPCTQGSNCALTPYGESGIAYGFCSFVGYRIVVGKHISPTPLCCSVGFEVTAVTSILHGVFICLGLPPAILLWWRPGLRLCRMAQFGPSPWGPRPMASVVGGSPPLLLHPSATLRPRHGGRGLRESGIWGQAPRLFCRLAPWVAPSGWSSFLRPRPRWGWAKHRSRAALDTSGDTLPLLAQLPTRPLRPRYARPRPTFPPKAPALLVIQRRGPFKLTWLARQPRNNLKLSPRRRTTRKQVTHAVYRFCYSTKAWQKRTRTTGAILFRRAFIAMPSYNLLG